MQKNKYEVYINDDELQKIDELECDMYVKLKM